jgi:hypothetical protein
MNERIKSLKQETVKALWNPIGKESWYFDENLCKFVPPIPMPTDDNKPYYWDEATKSWLVT